MDKSGVRSVIDRTLGPRGTLLAFSYGDIFASLLGCYLTGGDCIDLDFDHQFIPAGKKDAEYSYKNAFGYFPGVASVGGLIVGIENRDGNTNVKFHQKDTLERIFQRLEDEARVLVRIFRSDCGSFSEKAIIEYYNKRGASERNFDCLNNDFGWAHLPFSFLNENTVFLIATAILKNFYLYFLGVLRGRAEGVDCGTRIKRFVRRFVNVPAKWTRSGRMDVLTLYTKRQIYLSLCG